MPNPNPKSYYHIVPNGEYEIEIGCTSWSQKSHVFKANIAINVNFFCLFFYSLSAAGNSEDSETVPHLQSLLQKLPSLKELRYCIGVMTSRENVFSIA